MKKKFILGLIPLIALSSCTPIHVDISSNSSGEFSSKNNSNSNTTSSNNTTNISSDEPYTSNSSSSKNNSSSSVEPIIPTPTPKDEIIGESPIFYGASSIKISNDLLETFDPYDSRWRVYVKDYEDGDLTHNISLLTNNVNPKVAGEYNVIYSINDSDNNIVNFTQNIEITAEPQQNIEVKRIVYAIPQMKNMKDVGMERGNNADSQNLGIYLPSGTSATIEYIGEDKLPSNFKITNCTNTRVHNNIYSSSTSINIVSNRDNVSYDCIPLITSPRLNDETYDKTYLFKLTYDKSVQPLTYYHYNDNEDSFFTTWNNNQHSFALVDGEAFQIVVPLEDKDNLVGNGKDFSSLKEVCEYYINVVNRYDKMAGLSFNADDPLDKNYRTKYLGLADGYWQGKGIGAFYESSYIGIGNYSTVGFFRYGWGSLHEFGHGYQGNFGKGIGAGDSIRFNETGNNILAHYVQIDKTLYKADGDWLGNITNIEESKNSARLNGTNIFIVDGTYAYASEKLYFIINLLDVFGGEKVYGELFSYYRHIYSTYGNIYTIPDIYAKFFFEKYNANIIPYLNAWKLDVSYSVKLEISSSNAKNYVIPKDILSESELNAYKETYPNALVYAPTTEEKLSMLDVKYDLNISINIDDISKLKNKFIGIKQNDKFITKIKIEDSNTLSIKELSRGYYEVIFPAIDLYDLEEAKSIYLSENNNSISNTYTKIDTIFDHESTLRILGKANKTVGFQMKFSQNHTKADLTFGGSNLGNQNNWWTGERADLICSSVIVKDINGTELYNWTVKGKGYFSSLDNKVSSIDLEYGYTIEVYYYFGKDGNYVNVYSNNSSDTSLISDYNLSSTIKTFEVTKYGLKLFEIDNFDVETVMYNKIKSDWIDNIKTLSNSLEEESLNNRNLKVNIKNNILKYYSYLKDEDKPSDIEELLSKIKKGGSPIITLIKGENINIKINENINLYSLISIYDNEDFDIISNSDNVKITTDLDINKVGQYIVRYEVIDSDNNISTITLNINVSK